MKNNKKRFLISMDRVDELSSWNELVDVFNKKQFLACDDALIDKCQSITTSGITLNYAMQFIAPNALDKSIDNTFA